MIKNKEEMREEKSYYLNMIHCPQDFRINCVRIKRSPYSLVAKMYKNFILKKILPNNILKMTLNSILTTNQGI